MKAEVFCYTPADGPFVPTAASQLDGFEQWMQVARAYLRSNDHASWHGLNDVVARKTQSGYPSVRSDLIYPRHQQESSK